MKTFIRKLGTGTGVLLWIKLDDASWIIFDEDRPPVTQVASKYAWEPSLDVFHVMDDAR